MIIGLSHLVLCTSDLDATREALLAAGFTLDFQTRGMVDAALLPFTREPLPDFRMAFMRVGGVAVEVVNYGRVMTGEPGPARAWFSGVAASSLAERPGMTGAVWRATLGSSGAEWRGAGIPPGLWIGEESAPPGVRAIQILVRDLARAREFWQAGLGFRCTAGSDTPLPWLRLELVSPLAHWRLVVILRHHPEAPAPCLNREGWSCVSLLSSNLVQDGAALAAAGATLISPPFRLELNRRQVELMLLAGPDGVVVELLRVLGTGPAPHPNGSS